MAGESVSGRSERSFSHVSHVPSDAERIVELQEAVKRIEV